MSDSRSQQEPSIEEILSSIRQIINEDPPADSAPKSPPPASLANVLTGEAAEPDEILDLADIVGDTGVRAAVDLNMSDVLSRADNESQPSDEDDFDFQQPLPKAAPVAPPPMPAARQAPAEDDSLLSSDAIGSVAASLAKLVQAEVMIDHKHAAGIGSVTLEDVVKEMLRPLMKSWLDQNLPPMVERLVQKEIQKLSSRLQ